ncbi:MAG: beta-glucosidase family protein [Spirochaetota bacterium]
MTPISKASATLSEMTPDEKLALLAGVDNMYTRGVPRLGVRRLRMADASMGLKDKTIDATAFPAFIALAATWNRDRARDYGTAVGEEFRAANVDIVLGPGVNLYRVHECGRNFEYLGEDPWLAASLVVPYIAGVQATGVSATVKHYVANNTDWHRCMSDSIVDERTLRELYLLPFEAAVKDARVSCLMTSYNLVNGEYAGESERLVTSVLQDEWGFSGLVMSDWWALWNTEPAIASGLHLEMPEAKAFDPEKLRAMLDAGSLSEEQIDARARRILETTFRIEERRREIPDPRRGKHEEHAGAALEVAREGIVLLKNADGLLPLSPASGSIAVVGPHADPTPTTGGGAAAVRAIDPVSIAGGVVAVAPDRKLLRVVNGASEDQVLADADVAIVCVGLTPELEHEGSDRPYELPEGQVALIKKASRTARRVVVVLVAGGGVETTSWVDDVDSILHLWYPGEIGARALAEILFGQVNPSGKLPISIERRYEDRAATANYLPEGGELYVEPDYVSQSVPRFPVRYAEGVFAGYRHLDAHEIEPLFAFGHGLSYTSYGYSRLAVAQDGDRIAVTFTVMNEGERDGLETAQVYARPPASLAHFVPRKLVGFSKRAVESGRSLEYRVVVPLRAIAGWDTERGIWVVPAGEYVFEVGASSRDIRLTAPLEISEHLIDGKAGVL